MREFDENEIEMILIAGAAALVAPVLCGAIGVVLGFQMQRMFLRTVISRFKETPR